MRQGFTNTFFTIKRFLEHLRDLISRKTKSLRHLNKNETYILFLNKIKSYFCI